MKTKEFHFNLPHSLIAQYPSEKRGSSRLMVLDPQLQKIYHENSVNNILKYINSNIFIIFNNSKVRKSRIYVESEMSSNFLILDRIDTNLFTALVSKSKKQIIGNFYKFPEGLMGEILSKNSSEVVLKFNNDVGEDYFEKHCFVPLPSYIKRDYDKIDEDRYRTIYSKYVGSAASATAGLHFSIDLFSVFENNNIEYDFITLHVGLGTFLPVRSKKVEEHDMHFETFLIKDFVFSFYEEAINKGYKFFSYGDAMLILNNI
ncbi:tRNA preQ1(34) S-adenosylmethionine ribosyltransferase-isomerase QueA [Borreliella burgdorferi]|uniref:tRNA preQ1(34) S-adenosylmethionine ribosyltransferase-isomerase QueA n=1 Tax=Borreliella burgdorferi TaxID=139 RepID=UPI000D03CB29|nr:tRNA preQ1(34) S-adenosylmethionine ribosyltransferase-isomerase QueA [Borreliella burgdorferi]PRR51877.1 tRNA preQ1(34) S-adenosylmethionine ribosyltransferase-isomerase QueA [Borreliella burgdorferi]